MKIFIRFILMLIIFVGGYHYFKVKKEEIKEKKIKKEYLSPLVCPENFTLNQEKLVCEREI